MWVKRRRVPHEGSSLSYQENSRKQLTTACGCDCNRGSSHPFRELSSLLVLFGLSFLIRLLFGIKALLLLVIDADGPVNDVLVEMP